MSRDLSVLFECLATLTKLKMDFYKFGVASILKLFLKRQKISAIAQLLINIKVK